VAVGDVVNKLPVGINVEGVTESWRDQSGKYWIGNEEPKLCFCRILRSQTVMVRVGGGWAELSKSVSISLFVAVPDCLLLDLSKITLLTVSDFYPSHPHVLEAGNRSGLVPQLSLKDLKIPRHQQHLGPQSHPFHLYQLFH